MKEKEERELDALRAEQQMAEAQERERVAKDRKWRKRAKAQKKKVDRFRSGIRENAVRSLAAGNND